MKISKSIKILFCICTLGFLFSCNQAFVAGMAEGLAGKRYNSTYSNSSYSSQYELNKLQRQQRELENRQRNMERNAKRSCRDLGGRWRVGRCKF